MAGFRAGLPRGRAHLTVSLSDGSAVFPPPGSIAIRAPASGGERRRHHLHESAVQRAVRQAAVRARSPRRVTGHTFRHGFASHLLEAGHDLRTVQKLLGHASVKLTMVYTHVAQIGAHGVRSPFDVLR